MNCASHKIKPDSWFWWSDEYDVFEQLVNCSRRTGQPNQDTGIRTETVFLKWYLE